MEVSSSILCFDAKLTDDAVEGSGEVKKNYGLWCGGEFANVLKTVDRECQEVSGLLGKASKL